MKKVAIGSIALMLATLSSTAFADSLTTPYNDGVQPMKLFLKSGNYPSGQQIQSTEIDWKATGQQIPSPSLLKWTDSSGYYFPKMEYIKGTVDVGKNGSIDHLNQNMFDDSTSIQNNGYWLVAEDRNAPPSWSNISDWATELGGDPQYVSSKGRGKMTYGPDSWGVMNFAVLINDCGASIANTAPYISNGDGTATPYMKIIPTPAPTSSLTTDKLSYNVGDKVVITGTANLYANATTFHQEAIKVTGPNGFFKYLPLTNNDLVPSGTSFPYNGEGNGTTVHANGGGSGDPSNPNVVKDIANFDTSGLQEGTYNVEYTVYDNVGRAATNGTAKVSFTVSGTGSSSGGSSNPSDYNGNLRIKFAPLTQAMPFMSSPTIALEVTNIGNKDVTTSVNFSAQGSDSSPQNSGGSTTETNYDMTESNSFSVTAPANKTVIVNVPSNVLNPLYDGWYQQWQTYNAQYQVYQNALSAYRSAYSAWSQNTDPNKGPAPSPPSAPTQPSVPNVQPNGTNPDGTHQWKFNVGERWVQGTYTGPTYNGQPGTWYVPDPNYNMVLQATINSDHSILEQTYSDNTDTLIISPGAPNPPGGHNHPVLGG